MAETWFSAKEWKARLVEFAGRRMLRNVANGETATYDVSRSEGQISQEGDAFNTKNMNDLEQRVANGFASAKAAVDTLTDKLEHKMWQYCGSATLSEVNEKAVLKHLLLDIDLPAKYRDCDFSVVINNLQFYSGIMYSDGGQTAWGQIQQRNADNMPGSLYSFYYNRGADPVLKKMGNDSPNTITVTLLKGSGKKSLEGMNPVVLTKQEDGQYKVTSAPTSFGVRNESAVVDWGYNMGGASIMQE